MVDIIHALGELLDRVGVPAFILICALGIVGLIVWTNWRLNSTVFELTGNVLSLNKRLGDIQNTTILANTMAMHVNTAAAEKQTAAIKEQSDYLKKMGGSDPTGLCKVNDNIEKIRKVIIENGYQCPSEGLLTKILERIEQKKEIRTAPG